MMSCCYVDNVVYGHLLAASKLKEHNKTPAAQTFNITDGKNINYWDFVKFFVVGMGVKEHNFAQFSLPSSLAYYFAYANELLRDYWFSVF